MSNFDIRLVGIENVEPYKLTDGHILYTVPPPEMLVEGFLPKATVTGLTAPPGKGKTWLALELSRAVSTGGKFLGVFKSEEAPVLYVGSDSSLHDYAQQWRRLTQQEWAHAVHRNVNNHEPNLLEENVRFLIQSDFMLDSTDTIRKIVKTSMDFEWGEPVESIVWKMSDAGAYPVVDGYRRRRGFGLIIFDTFSKLTRANQNDNTLTEECFRNMRFVSEQTGACVVVLHHNAARNEFNDGEQWRGATAAEGALDNRIQLSSDPKDKYVIQAEFKKFRGITPAPVLYRMNVDDIESASLTWVEKKEETKTFDDGLLDAILVYLGTHGQWMKARMISDALWESFTAYYPSEAKFRTAVKTRMDSEARRPTARIDTMCDGPGSPRMYKLIQEEK